MAAPDGALFILHALGVAGLSRMRGGGPQPGPAGAAPERHSGISAGAAGMALADQALPGPRLREGDVRRAGPCPGGRTGLDHDLRDRVGDRAVAP